MEFPSKKKKRKKNPCVPQDVLHIVDVQRIEGIDCHPLFSTKMMRQSMCIEADIEKMPKLVLLKVYYAYKIIHIIAESTFNEL